MFSGLLARRRVPRDATSSCLEDPMVGIDFDDLARRFGRHRSRRQALKLLAGAAAGAAFGTAGWRPSRLGGGVAAAAFVLDQEIDYFGLGDSQAAGHGLMPTDPERDGDYLGMVCTKDGKNCCPQNGTTCCRRSNKSYPYKVAAKLRTLYRQVNFEPTTHHLACSGAISAYLEGQVEHVVDRLNKTPSERTVLVSITVGPNDFEFTDPEEFLAQLLVQPNPVYKRVSGRRLARLRRLLTLHADTLLSHPHGNVKVVITEQHNPFNEGSVFFADKWLVRIFGPGGVIPGFLTRLLMFTRSEQIVSEMNEVYRDVVADLALKHGADRIALAAGTRRLFMSHRSPRPECGDQDPGVAGTWFQYPSDPKSNSFALPLPGARGDCFHPNEAGQQTLADAVFAAARGLGIGRCTGECADGKSCCDGDCIDPQTNPLHCGACGNNCQGKNCREGACVCKNGSALCAADDECCSGTCFQIEGPPFRPARCTPVEECAPGETKCNDTCVSLGTDAHCGACGDACQNGTTCCGGTCVDLQTDEANCGACGSRCLNGTCQGGACGCPTGQTLCGTLCVDLKTNRNHCGRCSNACGTCHIDPPPSPGYRLQCVEGICEECPGIEPTAAMAGSRVDASTAEGRGKADRRRNARNRDPARGDRRPPNRQEHEDKEQED